ALNGAAVSFMAKWSAQAAGNSCHIHSSLRSVGPEAAAVTLFFDANSPPLGMSELLRHYVAGQLALARELTYLFAPAINSYKRYQSTSFAPTAVAWGHDNRTCGFRLVGANSPSIRVENRVPGGDANPYLAFAATIAAGLYGIEHRLEPPPMLQADAYH